MKQKYFLIIAFIVCFLPCYALAQMTDETEIKEISDKYDMGLGKQPSSSLLDLSRLNLSHSYSLSFFSGGGISGSQGLYNGSLTYQISRPLTLTMNLGILHNPGSFFNNGRPSSNDALFLPSGRLDWKPSNNFQMSISFETIPAYRYGSNNIRRYNYWRD